MVYSLLKEKSDLLLLPTKRNCFSFYTSNFNATLNLEEQKDVYVLMLSPPSTDSRLEYHYGFASRTTRLHLSEQTVASYLL